MSANPPGSAARPRRTAAASAPASGATRSASSSSGARVGVNTTCGHHALNDPAMQASVDAYADPWAEASNPATATQFASAIKVTT